jgi:glyoxylase-like metal-dependent hydrolase (beta-lactamase superfamily II)
MQTLASDLDYIDLTFLGVPQIIATVVLRTAGGVALIDPGPTSCLDTLRRSLGQRGASIHEVQTLLLTHIHLDHAGATGMLVRENPAIRVFVHQRGAPHVIDPSRLLESARRLYGANMDRLWGAVLPVPTENVHALSGGERIRIGVHDLDVAYTPGHASHHVSYFDARRRIAFVGDTAGVRTGGGRYVLAPTPPPDIDLEAWSTSVAKIESWQPDTLFLTHFGPFQPVAGHLQDLLEHLRESAEIVRRTLETGEHDAERMARYIERMRLELRRHMSEEEVREYETACPLDQAWLGLARYWRKRQPG